MLAKSEHQSAQINQVLENDAKEHKLMQQLLIEENEQLKLQNAQLKLQLELKQIRDEDSLSQSAEADSGWSQAQQFQSEQHSLDEQDGAESAAQAPQQ